LNHKIIKTYWTCFQLVNFFLFLESLVCNDVQESRIKKLHNVMSEFIIDYESWGSRLMITQMNARDIDEPDVYNKVNISTVLFYY
jgi:hypothetical protein